MTTITGPGMQGFKAGPEVGNIVVQGINNLSVVVDDGPTGNFSLAQANVLYATVTLCEPGTDHCQSIDHVQVDTGSVGLRVLASKVRSLALPAVEIAVDAGGKVGVTHECYPFVIGGLWGPNKVADLGMGQQWARAIPIQLIDDQASPGLPVPADCTAAVDGQVLNSASALGSNGILGIGSVTLDCG
ncbi:MAG: DUF3443 family protein, partial [Rhodoferax sp.]